MENKKQGLSLPTFSSILSSNKGSSTSYSSFVGLSHEPERKRKTPWMGTNAPFSWDAFLTRHLSKDERIKQAIKIVLFFFFFGFFLASWSNLFRTSPSPPSNSHSNPYVPDRINPESFPPPLVDTPPSVSGNSPTLPAPGSWITPDSADTGRPMRGPPSPWTTLPPSFYSTSGYPLSHQSFPSLSSTTRTGSQFFSLPNNIQSRLRSSNQRVPNSKTFGPARFSNTYHKQTLLSSDPSKNFRQNIPHSEKINFETSAQSPQAQQYFLQGLSLFFNQWYEEAVTQFKKAEDTEPAFAMAYWGEILSYQKFLTHELPNDEEAIKAYHKLQKVGQPGSNPKLTDREKAYLQTLSVLVPANGEPISSRSQLAHRSEEFMQAMEKVAVEFKNDTSAATIYALSKLEYGVDTLGVLTRNEIAYLYEQAKEILNTTLYGNTTQPGVIPYLLHIYDQTLTGLKNISDDTKNTVLPVLYLSSFSIQPNIGLQTKARLYGRLNAWALGLNHTTQSLTNLNNICQESSNENYMNTLCQQKDEYGFWKFFYSSQLGQNQFASELLETQLLPPRSTYFFPTILSSHLLQQQHPFSQSSSSAAASSSSASTIQNYVSSYPILSLPQRQELWTIDFSGILTKAIALLAHGSYLLEASTDLTADKRALDQISRSLIYLKRISKSSSPDSPSTTIIHVMSLQLEGLEAFYYHNQPFLSQAVNIVKINEPWSSNRVHNVLSQAIAMEDTIPHYLFPGAFVPSRELYAHLLVRTGDKEYTPLASDLYTQTLKAHPYRSQSLLGLLQSYVLMNQSNEAIETLDKLLNQWSNADTSQLEKVLDARTL